MVSGYRRAAEQKQRHGRRVGVRQSLALRALAARRPTSRRRGQTLVIFALSLTVLIAILGLSIDTIRIFDLYGRMQRAAEAAALAGVIYMPNSYTADLNQPPGDNAVCRALQEAIKNGFGQACGANPGGYCPANPASVEVSICPVAGKNFDLRVTITESANVLFLSALNVGPVTLTASAQAEYLPPIPIGLDTTHSGTNLGIFGGYGDCNAGNGTNPVACTTGYHQRIMANINGPADLKEMGDPYVACEEGAAHATGLDQSAATLTTYTGYTAGAGNPGILTNHPQFTTDYSALLASHCNANNSDRQAFYGPQTQNTSHPGAYSYMVEVTQNAGLWIYNAPFVPTNGGAQACTGKQQLDGFYWYTNSTSGGVANCEGFYQQYGPSTFNGFFDNPAYYYNVTYSLYPVTNVTDPLADTTPIAQYTAHPYDGMASDLAKYGCSGSQVVDIDTLQCVNQPNGQWGYVQLAAGLPQGTYRVEVEATAHVPGNTPSGWGEHTYGLKLCPASVSSPTAVADCDDVSSNVPGAIGGWNNADMTLFYPNSSGVTGFPLGVIPTEYAGRTIDVSLFDAGDPANIGPSGNTFVFLAPPDPNNSNQASCSTNETSLGYRFDYGWANSRVVTSLVDAGLSNSNSALQTSASGDNAFNGIWVDITTRLPSTYAQGQWLLCGAITNGQGGAAQDTLAISISSPGQSPVHLVA